MTDVRRCPSCGAQNAASAEWCTLCLTRFPDSAAASRASSGDEIADELAEIAGASVGAESPPKGRSAAEGNGTQRTTLPVNDHETASEPQNGHGVELPPIGAVDEGALAAAPPAPVRHTRVRMLKDGDRVRWVCPVCSTMNDIEASACRICGTVMATLFAPESGAAPAPKAVGTATALTALLPGAGQAYLGAIATGMARAALYVWTLFIAVLFLVHPPSQSRALMRGIGVLFAAAAASVWGLAFVDTRRAGRGELAPVLDSRTITWTAMGLVVVLFIALTIAAFARR